MANNKDLERDIEILRQQMQRNTALAPPGQEFDSPKSTKNTDSQKPDSLIEEIKASKKRGYDLLLEELSKSAKNDEVAIEDEESVPLSAFTIKESAISNLKGKNLRELEQEEGITILDMIGYSENMVTVLYVVTDNLIDEKRFDDAIDALNFLIGIAPYISLFWKKLAEVYFEKQKWDDLLNLLKHMISIEPEDIDNHTLLLEYALETKDYDKTIEIMEKSTSEDHKDEIKENIKILEAIKQGGK